jgi:hypothetical protein
MRVGKDDTTVEQPNSAAALLDLETVVRRLYASNLRAGIQVTGAGLQVWISDRLHRVREERLFTRSGTSWKDDSAAHWLHVKALLLFPDSAYARNS